MTDDDIKKIEQRGYAKGYAAGKLRKQKTIRAEQREREIKAFRQRAFLAALPACIATKGWTIGERKLTNVEDKIKLAWLFADAATRGFKQ